MTTFKGLLEKMATIRATKNADYGDSYSKNFERFGAMSIVSRMYEKLDRVKNLTEGNKQLVKDEKVEDTLIDLANMCLVLVLELEKENDKKTKTKEDLNATDFDAIDMEIKVLEFGTNLMGELSEARTSGDTLMLLEQAQKDEKWNKLPSYMMEKFIFIERDAKGLVTEKEKDQMLQKSVLELLVGMGLEV